MACPDCGSPLRYVGTDPVTGIRWYECVVCGKRVAFWEVLKMETCSSCGEGSNTVEECPECSELLCQDCEETHICDF